MKKIYHTQQRKELIDFLDMHKEKSFTIEEIIEHMKDQEAPAPSSIYRLMKQLVEEGIVKRFVREGSRQFLYQLVNGATCSKHFHLKCDTCGRLFHLSEKASRKLQDVVFDELGFEVAEDKNILFGKCKECSKEK